MKLIIDIPEEVYKTAQKTNILEADVEMLAKTIKNGIPLDKMRTEIHRKAVYYEAEVNTNIASGMYKAIDIIDKYKGARDETDN